MWRIPILLLTIVAIAHPAGGATTDPIKLTYLEGDYAGSTTIWSEDGKRILGFITYRQHRHGNRLHIERVARFRDGSSDEDTADVEVGERLRALGGRSIIRDTHGKTTVDLRIDVAARHVTGSYLDDGKREVVDEEVDIGPGTYWGPMYQLVMRIIDMEFARDGGATVSRPGGAVNADRITLLPTVNFLIDPILQRLVPKTEFLVAPGEPPALARFTGPRNYAGQMMRLE